MCSLTCIFFTRCQTTPPPSESKIWHKNHYFFFYFKHSRTQAFLPQFRQLNRCILFVKKYEKTPFPPVLLDKKKILMCCLTCIFFTHRQTPITTFRIQNLAQKPLHFLVLKNILEHGLLSPNFLCLTELNLSSHNKLQLE